MKSRQWSKCIRCLFLLDLVARVTTTAWLSHRQLTTFLCHAPSLDCCCNDDANELLYLYLEVKNVNIPWELEPCHAWPGSTSFQPWWIWMDHKRLKGFCGSCYCHTVPPLCKCPTPANQTKNPKWGEWTKRAGIRRTSDMRPWEDPTCTLEMSSRGNTTFQACLRSPIKDSSSVCRDVGTLSRVVQLINIHDLILLFEQINFT